MTYELSPEENEGWFQKYILPDFIKNSEPSENPTFVLLTGQSGAGKSFISENYSKRMKVTPILFGADDLRAKHPHTAEILQKDEKNYPFLTKKDSGIWREKLVDWAIANKRNILIESILISKDDWKMGTLMKLREAGYQTYCIAMGVHRFQSLCGMFLRYETQKAERGVGFPPTVEVHEKAYEYLGSICTNMLRHKTMDSVVICSRGGQVFYDSDKQSQTGVEIYSAINKARNKIMTSSEINKIFSQWETVFKLMDKRDAPMSDFREAKRHYDEFMYTSGLFLDQGISALPQKRQEMLANNDQLENNVFVIPPRIEAPIQKTDESNKNDTPPKLSGQQKVENANDNNLENNKNAKPAKRITGQTTDLGNQKTG